MLILSRKVGERIVIGSSLNPAENVEVELVRIAGNVVRLGIAAPSEVPVLRGELERRERGEDEAA